MGLRVGRWRASCWDIKHLHGIMNSIWVVLYIRALIKRTPKGPYFRELPILLCNYS